MKLSAFIICYNADDYLEYVLRSALEWVDEVVVVEGALQITMATGKPLRSTDDTLEILECYKNTHRVFTVNAEQPFARHADQYSAAFEITKRHGADWSIMIDADEVYPSETQRVVRKTLERGLQSKLFGFRVHSYNFINDFSHYYDGIYKRIYRVTLAAHFLTHSPDYDNEVCWPDYHLEEDRMLWPPPPHIGVIPSEHRFFHYSYVRSPEALNNKVQVIWNKNRNPDCNPKNPRYRFDGSLYRIPDDIPIKEFKGKHPPIMLEHPYAQRQVNV